MYLGTVEGHEGEAEKESCTGKGHWRWVNGSVLCAPGQRTFQGETQLVQRHEKGCRGGGLARDGNMARM